MLSKTIAMRSQMYQFERRNGKLNLSAKYMCCVFVYNLCSLLDQATVQHTRRVESFAIPPWLLQTQISSSKRFLTRFLGTRLGSQMGLDFRVCANLRLRLADENNSRYRRVGIQARSAQSRVSPLVRDWRRVPVGFASVRTKYSNRLGVVSDPHRSENSFRRNRREFSLYTHLSYVQEYSRRGGKTR